MAHTLQVKNLETLKACDLCIICAKPEETAVLVKEFSLETKISSNLVDGAPPAFDFYIGSFALENSSVAYYLTNPSRQGIQTFGIEVAALFSILKPKHAVHVGVCAALSGQNFHVEDVIFGERALNYEEGKWALEDDEVVFKPDVRVAEVKGAAMGGFITQKNQPIYKYGDFVSGCAVRMDASFIFDRVKNTALRKVAALDMEASAFLQACEYTGVKALGIIKGVSDMGDHNKGLGHDKHNNSALHRAARATEGFVKYRWKTMPPKVAKDRSGEPGAVITNGYFDNFIARVMVKLERTEYRVSTEIPVEGLRIVLPEKLKTKDSKGEDVDLFDIESFNANTGSLALLARQNGLQEITLKGAPRNTAVLLKGSYLVDLPTTLPAGLANMPSWQRNDQVELFRESLEGKVQCYKGFVQVISWDEFQKL